MKNKSKKLFMISGALLLLFIIFTIIIMNVDVKPIGPEQSSVGLATLNQFIFERLGVNLLWYDVTDWLGNVSLLFAVGFAVLGLYQLIKRKSLLKVDYQILLLSVFYILVISLYLFFEAVIINYRPILLNTALEASYPSSHTMTAICIMSTAMLQFHRLFGKKKKWLVFIQAISILLIIVTVIGRLISGVHWFTDIVGGVMLSSALIMLYYSAISYLAEKRQKAEEQDESNHMPL